MSEKPNSKARVDRRVYVENRRKFTLEEINRYAGQWVAWSVDGSKVVAHHEDLKEAARLVQEAGLTWEDVIYDRIPPEGEVECLLPSLLDTCCPDPEFGDEIQRGEDHG